MFSNRKGILSSGRQTAAALRTTASVANIPIESGSSKATLGEVAAPIPKVESEDTFDGLADIHMSEERPAPRTRPI